MCCIIDISFLNNQTTIRHLSGEDDACPFFRQDDFVGRNAPVDVEVRIVPCQCPFALRGIKVVAFILENNFRREHAEAVGKTAGDKELAMVFFCQFYGYVLAERGRAFADIHGHINTAPLITRTSLLCAYGGF